MTTIEPTWRGIPCSAVGRWGLYIEHNGGAEVYLEGEITYFADREEALQFLEDWWHRHGIK